MDKSRSLKLVVVAFVGSALLLPPVANAQDSENAIPGSKNDSQSDGLFADSQVELAYDDGSSEQGWAWNSPGGGFAVQFTPPHDGTKLVAARIYFHALNNASDPISIRILDTNKNDIITPINYTVTQGQAKTWIDIDVSSHNVILNDDFIIAEEQLVAGDPDMGTDTSLPVSGRSWQFFGTNWSPVQTNYMIRAVVDVDSGIPLYVLKPYNLHLSLSGTNTASLHVYDEHGAEVTGGLSFGGYDSSLISVSAAGTVTALRAENSTEIGTWVHASVGGSAVQNTSVVRVLSADPDASLLEREGERTALYSPTMIDGEDIDQYVVQYQVPTVNEFAYRDQFDLVGVIPFDGARQVFAVDFGESESNRVCGISGNPIRLGWNLNGSDWNNCFLVPFTPPRSPQWVVFYHELGHNTTWPSYTFGNSIGPRVEYSEGVATYISLSSIRRIFENPGFFPLATSATSALQQIYYTDATRFVSDFQTWLDGGAIFTEINADIVDGLLLHHEAGDPDRFAMLFFNVFRPEHVETLRTLVDQATTDSRRHTFFAAMCSLATGEDLYTTFLNTYHFPLDESYYSQVCTALAALPEPESSWIFADGFESGDTRSWSTSTP